MKLTLLSISGTGSRLRPRSSSSEVLLLRDPKTMLKIVELKLKLKFKLSDCIVKLKLSSNKASRLFRQVKVKALLVQSDRCQGMSVCLFLM